MFHETLSPAGGYLRTCLATDGRWIGVLDMVSRTSAKPLQPADAAFMRLLAPTIASGLAAALVRERVLTGASGSTAQPSSSGILLLTPDRRVNFVTPAGERWLRSIQDAGRDEHSPVPTALWSAIAGLRLREQGNVACTVVAPCTCGPVRIEASIGGTDGSIAVVLTPVRQPGLPTVPEYWPLTIQEREVVALLLKGLSNHELAIRFM